MDPSIRFVSRFTAAFANVSSVFQLFSFPVVCSGMISKGFGFVVFFASVETSSVYIRLSGLVCLWSAVRGVCSRLFCGHKECILPEVSITSFLSLQFFVFVRLLESSFLTHIKMWVKPVCFIFSKWFPFSLLKNSSLQKTGLFGGLEFSYQQTYSARDWLSILMTP
jgi:hypothetical protein